MRPEKLTPEQLSAWIVAHAPTTNELVFPKPGSPAAEWRTARQILTNLIDAMEPVDGGLIDSNRVVYSYTSDDNGTEILRRMK